MHKNFSLHKNICEIDIFYEHRRTKNVKLHKKFVFMHKNKKFLYIKKALKIGLLEHFAQKHKNIYILTRKKILNI